MLGSDASGLRPILFLSPQDTASSGFAHDGLSGSGGLFLVLTGLSATHRCLRAGDKGAFFWTVLLGWEVRT